MNNINNFDIPNVREGTFSITKTNDSLTLVENKNDIVRFIYKTGVFLLMFSPFPYILINEHIVASIGYSIMLTYYFWNIIEDRKQVVEFIFNETELQLNVTRKLSNKSIIINEEELQLLLESTYFNEKEIKLPQQDRLELEISSQFYKMIVDIVKIVQEKEHILKEGDTSLAEVLV